MTFTDEIIRKSSVLQEESVDWDRIYELLDIFENASDYDDLMSDAFIHNMCEKYGVNESSDEYNDFILFCEKERKRTLYARIMENKSIQEAVSYNWSEILSYASVGFNWLLAEEGCTDKRSAIILHLLETVHDYSDCVLCYELLKYMYDNFRNDKEYTLP